MNRIYVISNDGRIFHAQPDSDSFEVLNYQEHCENFVKTKKLSSSSWCFWSISSSFNINLYVYELDYPLEHQAITYENQTLKTSEDITCLVLNHLPQSFYRPNFSSIEGDLSLPKEKFILPSDNWVWKTDWSYEQNASEGWEYAVDFPSVYHPDFFFTACVRRRKWMRTRSFIAYNKFINIEGPNYNKCLIDVSIGGWLIPFTEKGFLCVWAVSSSGNLYFRKDVSHSNPEGTKWIHVILPNYSETFSCSCSPRGDIWVVNDQGQGLFRKGISRETPQGTHWVVIDQPTDLYGIKEIGVGSNSVWILNAEGNVFFRAGITNKQPVGTKWVFVPFKMNNISVTVLDQLWALNSDENSIYIRYGIDQENLSGIGWKRISLKFKKFTISHIEEKEIMQNKSESTSNLLIVTKQNLDETKSEESVSIEKPQQEEINYYEFSIYDDIETTNQSSSTFINKSETQSDKNLEISIRKYSNLNNFEEVAKNVEEVNKNLDEFINNLKINDQEDFELSLNKSRSNSNISFNSFENLTLEKKNSHSKSLSSCTSSTSLENEVLEVDLHQIVCNSFNEDSGQIQSNWFDLNSSSSNLSSQNSFRKKDIHLEWRDKLIDDIVKRNLREFLNIDKISKPYENDSSWSRKEDFVFYYNNKLVTCIIEIIVDNNCTTLLVKLFYKSKLFCKMCLNFQDILLVTRHVLGKRQLTPCFAIYTRNEKQPYIFLASSEAKANEWVNQISIFCSKSMAFSSLLTASCLISIEGFAYYSFIDKQNPIYLSQINGHFKQIEKHLTGVTFGLGENGKLWLLNKPNNSILDSYKGPYLQTDELEVYTYENQRWNAVSAVLSFKNGFTKLGLPTDRYAWSDETGKIRRRKEEIALPSSLFVWISEWQVDYSLQPGVDRDGWQYAFDFPNSYHGVRNPIKDFVRRRRWVRKCRISTKGLWKEVNQTHKLSCIALDQEEPNTKLLDENKILIWATDNYGFVLSSLIDELEPSFLKWKYISSQHRFAYVSIGINLRIWAIDLNGSVYYRVGCDKNTFYCGTSWTLVNQDDNNDLKFKSLSVGFDTVWAVSKTEDLYFRENVSKSFPEGTNWLKIDSNIKYVSVNSNNEVYAITSETARNPNILLYRDGINHKNLTGSNWIEVCPIKCKMFSNRGKT